MVPESSNSADSGTPADGRSETRVRPQVVLVGAGPGDPELITLRGQRRLRQADVVLYDYLVNAQLLEACRPDALLVCLGKHGRDRILSQEEINARMVAEAQLGRFVVRLKGGDPAVFARFSDEVAALEAAGLRYEVVPGITTALAVGSHASVPLTDRRSAAAVALVTGHEQDEQEGTKLDYAGLAAFPGTLVFYMGVTNAPIWTRALIDAGKPATTPVAIIRRCSWPDQATLITTLGEAAEVMQSRKLRPPVVFVVGEVVGHRSAVSWFTDRPLFGRRVLLTRPEELATAARDRLRELGADVAVQPAIEIGDPDDFGPLDEALSDLGRFDWIVFVSRNGVTSTMRRIAAAGRDMRAFAPVRIAAIGPGTAETLAEHGLRADLIPPEFRAESLAAALVAEMQQAKGKRFLLIRASRGREVLADTLRAAGAEVRQVTAYRSSDVTEVDAEIAATIEAGKFDWVTVSSPSIARSLVALFGDALAKTKLASISPVTSEELVGLGYPPAAEARSYTLDGIVEAIVEAETFL
jgi:uroporphyrinogen III methyltransferase/synthase